MEMKPSVREIVKLLLSKLKERTKRVWNRFSFNRWLESLLLYDFRKINPTTT